MKLYGVSDGPPSLAVRMALKALNITYELVPVDYCASEHMTESYAKVSKNLSAFSSFCIFTVIFN